MAAIFDDGTAEGVLGEVVSDARKLGGQVMTGDWSRNGRILGIKWAKSLRNFGIKFVEFEDELRDSNRGLLLLSVWASILEHLGSFGVSLKLFWSLAGGTRRTT